MDGHGWLWWGRGKGKADPGGHLTQAQPVSPSATLKCAQVMDRQIKVLKTVRGPAALGSGLCVTFVHLERKAALGFVVVFECGAAHVVRVVRFPDVVPTWCRRATPTTLVAYPSA